MDVSGGLMPELTPQQLESVLLSVQASNPRLDFSDELAKVRALGPGPPAGAKMGPLAAVAGAGAPGGASTSSGVSDATNSADSKSQASAWDFVQALFKKYPLLAVLLAIVVIIAGVAAASSSVPLIGDILLFVVVVAVVGVIVAFVLRASNQPVISPVKALSDAMDKAGSSGCLASKQFPPKLHWSYWDVHLDCGGKSREFNVSFDGTVVEIAG